MPRPTVTYLSGALAATLMAVMTACSGSSGHNAAAGVSSSVAGTGAATPTTSASSAGPNDEFCRLEDVARQAGLAISTTQSDPTVLQAQVVAALDASKAAAAVAPADFADIAAKTTAEQEGVVALLKQYGYNFTEALASDDGSAFFSDPALAQVKKERDAYLQQHCNLAPTAGTSGNGGITLSSGDAGIRQLFQLLRLGGQVQISDQQVDCAVQSLSGVLSEADLQAIGAGTTVSDAGRQAFVNAISTCGITIPQA